MKRYNSSKYPDIIDTIPLIDKVDFPYPTIVEHLCKIIYDTYRLDAYKLLADKKTHELNYIGELRKSEYY